MWITFLIPDISYMKTTNASELNAIPFPGAFTRHPPAPDPLLSVPTIYNISGNFELKNL